MRFSTAAFGAAFFASSILCLCAIENPARGQDARFAELQRDTEELSALIDAENNKSALCQSYVGQVATVTEFRALIGALPKITEKGEFETTAQYEARIAAASSQAPGGPYVLTLPTDRDYLRYDADIQAMFVEAGAFKTGHFSDETLADMSAISATREAPSGGLPVFHSLGATKLTRSYSTTSRSGVPLRVSEFERQTNALYLTSPDLFAFAKDRNSPIMGFDVALARAPQLKQTVKVALVVAPQSPYLVNGSMGPIVPSLSSPEVYRELTAVAVVAAKCGLVLDGQNRVLASVDASL